jgi:Ca2+-binding RTX toxin-like protein
MGTPTVTIHIADRGTALSTGGASATGHMWYSLDDGNGNISSYGFSPDRDHEGDPFAPGAINALGPGESEYTTEAYSRTIEITPEQFMAMDHFGSDPAAGGFDMYYNGVDNSCIDFTWAALQKGGLDPRGFQGALWPTNNIDAVKDIGTENPPGTPDGVRWLNAIGAAVNNLFQSAINWRPRRDPLAIDLDSNGIQTLGIGTDPVLFDADGDGVKTGTGWLAPTDGWLVLDRNGNGTIDSGQELFGVDTVITNADGSTRKATSGFDALASLDTGNGAADSAGYHDGVFDANDAAFSQVRVWQDLNGDGISQANELFTLQQKGIISISLNSNNQTTTLGNGNSVSGTSTVTFANGAASQVDAVDLSSSTADNLGLTSNPFYRQFTDPVPLTAQAKALPWMTGSGWVRDMQEAASLTTTAGGNFAAALAQYAQASTRSAQRAMLDELIVDWAATSGKLDARADRPLAMTPNYDASGNIVSYSVTSADPTAVTGGIYPCVGFALPTQYYQSSDTVYSTGSSGQGATIAPSITMTAAGQRVFQELGALEVFNGSRFFNTVAAINSSTQGWAASGSGGSGGAALSGPYDAYQVTLSQAQVDFIAQAYAALQDSIYGALLLQTRLRPYLEAVQIGLDAQGAYFDASALTTKLDVAFASNPQAAFEDLADLTHYGQSTIAAIDYDGMAKLSTWIANLPVDSPIRNEFTDLHIVTSSSSATSGDDLYFGSAGNDALAAGSGNDQVDAGAGDDYVDGGAGNDVLFGRDGNDTLSGGDGNDTIDGGAGNDLINTGGGNNLVLFGRGDGQDVIQSFYNGDNTRVNTLQFKDGVAPSDIQLKRVNDDLIVSIAGTADSVDVQGFYTWSAGGPFTPIQQLAFSDGSTWNMSQIAARVQGIDLAGTDGADTLSGGAGADTLRGGAGDDTYLFGAGSGRDAIIDTSGNDVVEFGAPITSSGISLSQSGSDLEIDVVGAADALIVKNWYSGDTNHIEQFVFADGSVILDSQVQGLVQSMALFGGQGASATQVSGTSQQAQPQQAQLLAPQTA